MPETPTTAAEIKRDETRLTFGVREEGLEYPPRPGAYAVARNTEGLVAVFRTPRGLYLPGGGLNPGESVEDGLRREVREECGSEIVILRRIGEAVEYIHTAGRETGIAKECVFFAITFVGEPVNGEGEADHELVWVTPDEAVASLNHGSAGWAVREIT